MSKIHCVPHEMGISFTYDEVQYVYNADGFWHVGEEGGVQSLEESDVPLIVSELAGHWQSFSLRVRVDDRGVRLVERRGLWSGALFWMGGTARDRPSPYVGICAGLRSKRLWPLSCRRFSFRWRDRGGQAPAPTVKPIHCRSRSPDLDPFGIRRSRTTVTGARVRSRGTGPRATGTSRPEVSPTERIEI